MSIGQSTSPHFINFFQQGDEKAYDQIFRKYFVTLSRFATTFLKDEDDARDLVQDCFLKLWEQRTETTGIEYIKTYLYTIVRNRCIDALRRKKVKEGQLSLVPIDTETWERTELDELTKAETLHHVYEAIKTLPLKTQRVVQMHFIEGKNLHEIAAELNTSYNTVRNQKTRGLTILKGKFFPVLVKFFFYIIY